MVIRGRISILRTSISSRRHKRNEAASHGASAPRTRLTGMAARCGIDVRYCRQVKVIRNQALVDTMLVRRRLRWRPMRSRRRCTSWQCVVLTGLHLRRGTCTSRFVLVRSRLNGSVSQVLWVLKSSFSDVDDRAIVANESLTLVDTTASQNS